MMSDFEIRANNIATALEGAKNRVKSFGYEEDTPEEADSRIIGMFITWLTASEEARHANSNGSASFKKDVIDKLPAIDDPSWKNYIEPKPSSTLKQRAEALWGIRVAFTHGDGDINLIKNQINNDYALSVPNIFDRVKIENNKIVLNRSIIHQAIRTIVQIRDLL